MAGNKRINTADRRRKVGDLRVSGLEQEEIASVLGVSQPTVSRDLKKVFQMWREDAVESQDELIRIELKRIDKDEKRLYDMWDKSCTDYQKKIIKETNIINKRGRVTGEKKVEKSAEAITTFGNPAIMAQILKCREMRIRLLGIEAPKKIEHSGEIKGDRVELTDQQVGDIISNLKPKDD